MEQVGFAIVGVASHHSEFVARAVHNIPGAFLVGAYDEEEARARKFCDKFQTTYFPDLTSLLQNPNVKIGAVTSENSRKKDYAIALARTGKHVLCDKPLGITARESQEIIETCKS